MLSNSDILSKMLDIFLRQTNCAQRVTELSKAGCGANCMDRAVKVDYAFVTGKQTYLGLSVGFVMCPKAFDTGQVCHRD